MSVDLMPTLDYYGKSFDKQNFPELLRENSYLWLEHIFISNNTNEVKYESRYDIKIMPIDGFKDAIEPSSNEGAISINVPILQPHDTFEVKNNGVGQYYSLLNGKADRNFHYYGIELFTVGEWVVSLKKYDKLSKEQFLDPGVYFINGDMKFKSKIIRVNSRIELENRHDVIDSLNLTRLAIIISFLAFAISFLMLLFDIYVNRDKITKKSEKSSEQNARLIKLIRKSQKK